MRRVVLCLAFPILLCLVVSSLALAAPPVVTHVDVDRGRDVHGGLGGIVDWHEDLWIGVMDSDGAADLSSVTIIDTEGNLHTVAAGSPDWVQQGPVDVRVHWGDWSTPDPPPPGSYTVEVQDAEGNAASLTTAAAPEVPSLSPMLLYPDPESSIINETIPTFSWTGGVPGASDSLDIWEDPGPPGLWHYEAGAGSPVQYNADGTAAQPALTPGRSYLWVVHGVSCDDCGTAWTAEGRSGSALEFDGADDYVELGDLDLPGQIWVEAWVKVYGATGDWQKIVSKWEPGVEGNYQLGLTPDLRPFFEVGIFGSGTGAISDTSLSTNAWHHLSGSYDGSWLRLYVDGSLAAAYAISGPPDQNDLPTTIGRGATLGADASYRYFWGVIDEVRISALPPIALLSFDEGSGTVAHDTSGAGNDGVICGATWTAEGDSGSALAFDGADDYVELGDLDLPGQIWVEAWVKVYGATGDWQKIVSKWDPGAEGNYQLGLTPDLRPFFEVGISGSGTGAISDASLSTNAWHHLSGSYDGSLIRLYVDGSLAAAYAISGPPDQNDLPTTIGRSATLGADANYRYFWGVIDEVRISALPPMALFSFDEGSGTVVHDTSGVGNDGVLCGTTDPRVSIRTIQNTYGHFTVYSPNPRLQHVQVFRGQCRSIEGGLSYQEGVFIDLMDADGISDIADVTVTDSTGGEHTAQLVDENGPYALYQWCEGGKPEPPVPGPYSVTVTDREGHQDALTTASAPPVAESSPLLLAPAPNDSLVYDTTPEFCWTGSLPGAHDNLHVWDPAGGDSWLFQTDSPGCVEFNFDGTATQPELTPGVTYDWQIDSWTQDDDGSDPRVSISTDPHSFGRFTILPSTPVVPGSNVTVSVDGCDVTFGLVTTGGVLYGGASAELPSGDPAGYPVAGYGWDIGTTAVTSGTITVTMHYDEAAIPTGQEASLQLVRWDGSHWVDITVSRDLVSNTLTGECASLGRFTLYLPYPVLPELPGKLAYHACCSLVGILLYTPDPTARPQLGPDGSYNPDWSPDGSKLLYAYLGGLWVDALDGTLPTRVVEVGSDGRWSPDGRKIVYDVGAWAPGAAIWIANANGTDAHPIVADPTQDNVAPAWSPDGQWIAYGRWSNHPWQRLIRPDGTDDHAVVPTGVAAYPSHVVLHMASDPSVWSPDARRLAVCFDASLPDGSDWISGIGTISADGGPITPVWMNPPGLVCCGSAFVAGWSADGTSILFRSAHHLPPNPAWASGTPEPGRELWLIVADGSGQPVRLTYDSYPEYAASWWAPNTTPTQPGGTATITKGDTTITFESVTTPGVTTAVVYDTPPAPEPSGFQAVGDYYNISTTAQTSGTITIQIHYEDSEVPGGSAMEQWLSLLHWETDHWVDVTVRPIDTVNNIITGQCTSLSPFVVVLPTVKPDWLSPLQNGTSADSPAGPFKRGRTIPLKFRLLDAAGQPVSDALAQSMVAQLEVFYEKPDATGTPIDPGDFPPDVGGEFRYDVTEHQFIYNLSTKDAAWLANYTYGLDLLINGIKAGEVFFSLK